MGGSVMWFVFKTVFFFLCVSATVFMGALNIIPQPVAIIGAVGFFFCMGLTVAQLFCEDL